MYSREDLGKFYFQHQTEALPHGKSLQSFCVKNKVPYNIFQKWFKNTCKNVVEVQVTGKAKPKTKEPLIEFCSLLDSELSKDSDFIQKLFII